VVQGEAWPKRLKDTLLSREKLQEKLQRLFLRSIQTIVITLDTLSLNLKKRINLRILYDFRDAVVNRPDGVADAAFSNPLGKSVRVEVRVYLQMVFANGTFHDASPLTN
jgi:hypothetical protein